MYNTELVTNVQARKQSIVKNEEIVLIVDNPCFRFDDVSLDGKRKEFKTDLDHHMFVMGSKELMEHVDQKR